MVHSGLEALASAELAKLGIVPYIFSAILLKSINQNFKNDLQEFLRNLEEFDLKRLR
jgi:preprotein translocase subunit SecY